MRKLYLDLDMEMQLRAKDAELNTKITREELQVKHREFLLVRKQMADRVDHLQRQLREE